MSLPDSDRDAEDALVVLEADVVQLLDELMGELASHPTRAIHVD